MQKASLDVIGLLYCSCCTTNTVSLRPRPTDSQH